MKPKTIWLGSVLLLSSWIPAPAQDEEPRAFTPDVLMKERWQPEEREVGGKPILLSEEGTESLAEKKTLSQVVAERSFPEFAKWWMMGEQFSGFMSEALVSEWSALPGNDGDLGGVSAKASEYLKTVYDREARAALVEDFVSKSFSQSLQSGEFDALSYAFFRSGFELMEHHMDQYELPLEAERRLLTKRVGKRFFSRLQDHLGLELPSGLEDEASFARLRDSIARVCEFLIEQGYVRGHAAFRFDVEQQHQGRKIAQPESAFLGNLKHDGMAYALYEMAYPVILPSAVYLFHTLGEAQHHSSRTIEELFDRVGYNARESEDFDPSGYPSDMVVELWEISRKP